MSAGNVNMPTDGAVLAEYLEYLRDSGMTERWGPRSFLWARGGEQAQPEPAVPQDTAGAFNDEDVQMAGKTRSTATAVAAYEDPNHMKDPRTEPPEGGFSSLGGVREYLGECTRCKLCKGRTNIVFGVGNPDARLVFVGEGPGRDEDIKGEPFVGRAGQLLTDIIEKGMKLNRPDVYIANVVKCRPPENRNPEDDEIAACEPFLLAQLSVIKPRLICALGKFAAQTLLKTSEPISSLRGRVFDYHGMKLVPTYHPAYLLRNPKEKAAVWKDVQLIMSMYGE